MRSVSAIAYDIKRAWPKVNYAAAPYLDAMTRLQSASDPYYQDSGRSVINYFLANAAGFRGGAAKALKAELKNLVKGA